MYEDIASKASFLKKQPACTIAKGIHAVVAAIFEKRKADVSQSKTLQEFMSFNLSYAFLRNMKWHSSPLFLEILLSYMAEEFGLPSDIGEDINQQVTEFLSKYSLSHSYKGGDVDREFLRYVFVLSLTSKDDDALIAKLGIGTSIFKRVRRAAELADEIDRNHEKKEGLTAFVPELDFKLVGIISELAQDREANPLAFDLCRLEYVVQGIDVEWDARIKTLGVEALFALLLKMGETKELSQRDMAALIPKELKELLGFLKSRDLVFCSQDSTYDLRRQWSLTPTAYEITANAFATQALTSANINSKYISSLNGIYQYAVINILGMEHQETLLELLTVGMSHKIAPKALTACVKRLCGLGLEKPALENIEALFESNASDWIKRSACQALSGFGGSQQVKHMLKKLADRQDCEILRNAAITELLREPSLDHRHGDQQRD